jgi:hypothetical protein
LAVAEKVIQLELSAEESDAFALSVSHVKDLLAAVRKMM